MTFAFSIKEILDIVIITAALGFIFMNFFRPRRIVRDVVDLTIHKKSSRWNDFLFAAALIAPAVVFHEFGHKFVAMGFGFEATFSAAYLWLAIGIALRLMRFPFIFFVPAYVAISGEATQAQNAIIAFAGPAVNLVFWIGSILLIKYRKLSPRKLQFFHLFKQINMLLFIFNMLPIPRFDGSKVFGALGSIMGVL